MDGAIRKGGNQGQAGWYMFVIPATQEAEIRRSTVKANQSKKLVRPYLNKRAGHGGLCLSSSYMGHIGKRTVVPG
jgi:hypothetical protein